MSVIYETLQRVKNQSGQDIRRDMTLKRDHKIFLLRKSHFFKPWILCLVVLILLSAMGVAYGIYQLRTGMDAGSDPNLVIRKVRPQFQPAGEKGGLSRSKVDGTPLVPQFVPPTAVKKPPLQYAGKDLGQKGTASSVKIKSVPIFEKQFPRNSDGSKISRKRHTAGTTIPRIAKSASDQEPGYFDYGDSRRDKIHLANVKKSYKICRLIEQVKKSMQEMNHRQTEVLLEQLAALKGSDSGYVLKLKSYWLLQQDDYQPAMSLLKKVLARNENDLEAGINMAILEIKTNRLQQANKRLARLQETYPEDARIAEILKKLNSNPNPVR